MKLAPKFLFLIPFFITILGHTQGLEFENIIKNRKLITSLSTPSVSEAKESGVVLEHLQYVEYGFDTTSAFVCYEGVLKRVHLNDAKSVEMFNKIFLPVPNTEDLLYIKARSIAKNGKVSEVGMEAVKEIEENGRVYKILAVEGLEIGGELEYIAFNRRNNNTFGREILQNDVPVRKSILKIISPVNLIFEAKVYNSSTAKITSDSTKFKHFVEVELKDLPAVADEKYANVRANLVRADFKLSYNTDKGSDRLYTWESATNTFFDFLNSGNLESKSAVNNFLNEQKIKGLTSELAIRKIENYVKENLTYRESNEPETAADVLKNQYGDKSALVRLYVAAFDALKIPYEIIVYSPRTEAVFDKNFESWNFLDDFLFYFPTTKKYLDPLSPAVRYGLLNQNSEGTDALFIKPPKTDHDLPKYEIRTIPFLAVAQNHDDLLATVSFSPALDQIQGNFARTMTGHVATQLRPYFHLIKSEEEKKAIVSEIVKSVVKADAEYSNVQIKNTNITTAEGDKPFVFSVDVKLKSVVEKAGKKILFKVGELIGPQVEMYAERPRQFDIDMGNAHSYHRILKIQIPKGYKIASGLEALKMKITDGKGKPEIGFVSNYQLVGSLLTVTVDEFYTVVQLPKASFENFQKVINASADFNKITLILEK